MDKHKPSKTSRSVSSVPWITPEIRQKTRRKKNATHAKAKKTGSAKIRSKFETLRREIVERTGAVVKHRTLGREVPGPSPPVAVRCDLEQVTYTQLLRY